MKEKNNKKTNFFYFISFIIYINAREGIIITRCIRYIQLTLNINSYIKYNDMIKKERKNNSYKYICTHKHQGRKSWGGGGDTSPPCFDMGG